MRALYRVRMLGRDERFLSILGVMCLGLAMIFFLMGLHEDTVSLSPELIGLTDDGRLVTVEARFQSP